MISFPLQLTRRVTLLVLLLSMPLRAQAELDQPAASSPTLRLAEGPPGIRQVQLLQNGQLVLASPPEGLWSIATDWQNGWPASWIHAHPDQIEAVGPWTLARGTLKSPQGEWRLQDSYRPEGNGIRCVRRFQYRGEPAPRTTLSIRWQVPGIGASGLLPGSLYYGNPSGNRTQRGLVAAFAGQAGQKEFFEEHRYPMPFAFLEWGKPEHRAGAALHSWPSPVPHGHRPDQWWSLGVTALENSCEIALLSGPCAFRDQPSQIKIGQRRLMSYDQAWLDIPGETTLEKTFWIEAFPVPKQGTGFQRAVATSLDLFQPFDTAGLPDYETIVRDKVRQAQARWVEGPGYAGYRFHPTQGPEIVYGWCGQSAAPGYAWPVLEKWLGLTNAVVWTQKSLDFFATAPLGPEGFPVRYDVANARWHAPDPLSQGQALENLARAIQWGRRRSDLDTRRWEVFLREACLIHAQRILRDDWRPVSTHEGFLISPLCRASRLFGDERLAAAARKAARHYADRHLTMQEPYWGGTLDASCEDKEGAWAAFQAFLAVYELTGETEYLDWAAHACDVVLTYLQVWDIPMPPGRMSDHAFKTRGWTAVSAQNQHLDVYAVVAAPAIYRLGQLKERDDLQRIAVVMFRSCGQLIDAYGSQGEQIQQTNFAQGPGRVEQPTDARGGYNEHWTVFWITAHFLNAAAQFEEMGVRL